MKCDPPADSLDPPPGVSPAHQAASAENHRTRNARRKRIATRSRLLTAVMHVHSDREERQVAAVDDVLRAADLSRGTFYKYFTSMQQALDALGQQLADEMTVGVMPVYDELQHPLHRAAAGLHLFFRRGGTDPVWGTFISHTDYVVGQTVLVSNIRRDLEAGRDRGVLRFGSTRLAIDFLLGATKSGIQHLIREGANAERMFELSRMTLIALGGEARAVDSAIEQVDARLRAKAPGVLPWWRDFTAAALPRAAAPAVEEATAQSPHPSRPGGGRGERTDPE